MESEDPVVEIVRSDESDASDASPENGARHFRVLIQDDPKIVDEVRAYYALLQIEYTQRVAEIEMFLGFAEGCEALGTRLARLEAFVGIKAS